MFILHKSCLSYTNHVYPTYQYKYKQIHNFNVQFHNNHHNTQHNITQIMQKTQQLTEVRIRQIIQQEIYGILSQIKIEIETKIKAIDRNIIDLRSQFKQIQNIVSPNTNWKQLLERMEKIEVEIQSLRYYQMSMKDSRTRSLEKQRKPIFKKSATSTDLSQMILGIENNQNPINSLHQNRFNNSQAHGKPIGYQNQRQSHNQSHNQSPSTMEQRFSSSADNFSSKPPLPRRTSQESERKSSSSTQKRSRNPVLDSSSDTILKKWLNDNQQGRSSCFGPVIREQDIQQSVYL